MNMGVSLHMCVSWRTFEQWQLCVALDLFSVYFTLGLWVKIKMTHFFCLVATPHVFSNVLDTLDGLFDLRWHDRKGHHRVDALWTQLARHLPQIWCFWGLLPMLARARAFLSSAALHGREFTVSKLQTIERTSSDLLWITSRVSTFCFRTKSTFLFDNYIKKLLVSQQFIFKQVISRTDLSLCSVFGIKTSF